MSSIQRIGGKSSFINVWPIEVAITREKSRKAFDIMMIDMETPYVSLSKNDEISWHTLSYFKIILYGSIKVVNQTVLHLI